MLSFFLSPVPCNHNGKNETTKWSECVCPWNLIPNYRTYPLLIPSICCPWNDVQTGEYSCLLVNLTFKREFSYYLIQIYIPCCMLVIVSWVSFWLDPNAIPARVSLGVTTLLTMATQISGINASLPPVSYTKAIDVWTGVCLTFVFGALLEFALVNYASRSDAHRAAALHHQFLGAGIGPSYGTRRWDAEGNVTDDGMPPVGYHLVSVYFFSIFLMWCPSYYRLSLISSDNSSGEYFIHTCEFE